MEKNKVKSDDEISNEDLDKVAGGGVKPGGKPVDKCSVKGKDGLFHW